MYGPFCYELFGSLFSLTGRPLPEGPLTVSSLDVGRGFTAALATSGPAALTFRLWSLPWT